MPQWEFKCVRCHAVRTERFPSVEVADSRAVWCENPNCNPVKPGGLCRMERQLSAPNFAINGFSARNGYSKQGG